MRPYKIPLCLPSYHHSSPFGFQRTYPRVSATLSADPRGSVSFIGLDVVGLGRSIPAAITRLLLLRFG